MSGSRINDMELRGEATIIRALEPGDAEENLRLRRRNDDFLRPFEPIKASDYLTLDAQLRSIDDAVRAWKDDRAYSFGVFTRDGALIGKVGLSNVSRGAWQSATLGYFIDKDHNGRGHCTEAVGLIVEFAFDRARLHRVQAAVMPHNAASARVLAKNGFRFEGFAPKYLCINGRWEDHHVYSITVERYTGRPVQPDRR
jgi:ribosomal-protein-alanine N-acetyltransferase